MRNEGSMSVLVETEVSDNCPIAVTRLFSTLGEPRQISEMRMVGSGNDEEDFEVVGWSSEGPKPAYAALVEDSGDGSALLVYGAEEGIRLKPKGLNEDWDLKSPHQWGEACLLLDKSTQVF
ncbi:MAG: hypothetical protein HY666_02280 [Chloroflexi bacterium]|nr:hypothetical protein [Chloroflexota bacterium]